MRVVAGNLRGRRIPSHRSLASARLTPSPLKEAIFSRWGADLSGLRFLDPCAGSGQMGLEALSRGARVVLNEPHPGRHSQLVRLLRTWGRGDVPVHRTKAQALFRTLSGKRQRFDLIYLDPPYHGRVGGEPLSRILLEMLGRLDLLDPDGSVAVQHQKELVLPESCEGLEQVDQRLYGRNRLSTYRRPSRPTIQPAPDGPSIQAPGKGPL